MIDWYNGREEWFHVISESCFANACKRSQQKFSNVPLPPGKQTLYDYRRRLRETGSVLMTDQSAPALQS